MENSLLDFMSQYFFVEEIDKDENIFEAGYADSLFFMQLVMFLETEMQIQFESDDMNIDDFSSINRILAFVKRKKQIH